MHARSGGQNAPPTIVSTLIPRPLPPPPPPWFLAPPVARPAWVSAPALRLSAALGVSLAAQSSSALWDRLTWDAARNRLYVGLQTDGLAMVTYGAATNGVLGAPGAASIVAGTQGCNGLVIAGPLGFCGDAAGFTGTGGVYGTGITVLDMATLTVRSVVPIAQGVGVDNAVFDSFTGTVVAVLVDGSAFALNATTGAPLRTANLVAVSCAPSAPCDPLEFPVADGAGSFYVNSPGTNAVLRVDSRTLAVTKTYDTAALGCMDPTGLALDATSLRLFIGCADASAPMLLVLDAATGRSVATVPIGRGNDGVSYDARRGLIYASSGTVGTITVVQQQAVGGSGYAVREVLFSGVGARTMAFDPATGTLFTATADGRFNPALPVDADFLGTIFSANDWAPNTARVLAFAPAPTAAGR